MPSLIVIVRFNVIPNIVCLMANRQTVSLYHNSTVWLDTRDAWSWDGTQLTLRQLDNTTSQSPAIYWRSGNQWENQEQTRIQHCWDQLEFWENILETCHDLISFRFQWYSTCWRWCEKNARSVPPWQNWVNA